MKRKKLAVIPATVLAVGVLAVPAQGDSVKSCPTGDEPNPNWSTTQKGSCNSSHDPVTKNPGGNVPPGQQPSLGKPAGRSLGNQPVACDRTPNQGGAP